MHNIGKILHTWYHQNKRNLPWVAEKNPYFVWLSEIILQQTRVEHGIQYFAKFKKRFPTVESLAAAEEGEVLKMWEGLGYYTRARNLHATARIIAERYKGKFPSSYAELLQLKGIGKYTAAAIASYAFNLPHAVTDANVVRIIARIFGVTESIDTAAARLQIDAYAHKILDKENPATHNQAVMDFGALICKPVNPLCMECPVKKYCFAYIHDRIDEIPVKKKSIQKKKRYFHYFIITQKNKLIILKRGSGDIWSNLYEFPLIEEKKMLSYAKLQTGSSFRTIFGAAGFSLVRQTTLYIQQLTHQTIHAKFFFIETDSLRNIRLQAKEIIEEKDIKKFAFPGVIREVLRELD